MPKLTSQFKLFRKYSALPQTSKMERCVKMVKVYKPLIIEAKRSILDVSGNPGYTFAISFT